MSEVVDGHTKLAKERGGMSERIDAVLGYLNKMSYEKRGLLVGAMRRVLQLTHLFGAGLDGKEILSMSEKDKGLANGAVANFAFEVTMPEQLDSVLPKENGEIWPKTAVGVVKGFLAAAGKLRDGQKYPGNRKRFVRKGYPVRQEVDRVVRLIVPTDDGGDGFFDVRESQLARMLEPRYIDGNKAMATDLELVMKGMHEKVVGVCHGQTPRSMEQWSDPVELAGDADSEQVEPVWLVLSEGKLSGAKWMLRDPRIFAHLRIEMDEGGVRLGKLGFEFGHVPINGVGALMKMTVDSLRDISTDYWSGLVAQGVRHLPKRRSDRLEFRSHKIGYHGGVMPEEKERAYGDDEVGEACRQVSEKLDLFEVETGLTIPDELMGLIIKNNRSYGGMIGLLTLAGLLTSGQACFFPVNVEKGDDEMVVSLGLGGEVLTNWLRGVVGEMHESETYGEWSASGVVKQFWDYWNDFGWQETFEEEVRRASQDGSGSVTTILEATGAGARDSVEGVARGTLPDWALFFMSRWQISSTGEIPGILDNFAEKVVFRSAGSESVGVAIGILGNEMVGRFFTKDPLLMMEAVVRLMRTHGTVMINDLQKSYRDIAGRKTRLSGYVGKEWVRMGEVLQKLGDGENVDQVRYEGVSEPGLMEVLRSIGEGSKSRERALGSAGVMGVLLVETMKRNSGLGRREGWEGLLAKEFEFLAKQKTSWFLVHIMQLCLLNMARKGTNRAVADMLFKEIKSLQKQIAYEESQVLGGRSREQ